MGGRDFLKNALMQAMDPAQAMDILNNITTPGEELGGGLETVRMLEPKVISSFLVSEHPQTAAIILAHLDPRCGESRLLVNFRKINRMEDCS